MGKNGQNLIGQNLLSTLLRPAGRLCGMLAAAVIVLTPAGEAQAQGAVRSVHNDWQIRCDTPPGVLLPSGLGLKIDNAEVGRAGFVRCVPNGCVAEVIMDDNLIGKLRSGQSATFIIFQTPEEGIGFPISLKGFGEGFDKLP